MCSRSGLNSLWRSIEKKFLALDSHNDGRCALVGGGWEEGRKPTLQSSSRNTIAHPSQVSLGVNIHYHFYLIHEKKKPVVTSACMSFIQAIFLPPVVTFAGFGFFDMTDCGRRSLLLNDAKAFNKSRETTSLARTERGGRDRLSHLREETYKTIGIVRPVEEYAVDGFLDCENANCGGGVTGCNGWILCCWR